MGTRMTELHCKEVGCVGDGRRLGFVSEVSINEADGCVEARIVPGPCRFWGLTGRGDEFIIPWSSIRRIGPDIILVECCPDQCRIPRPKRGFWSQIP